MSDPFDSVPRTLKENLEFRAKLREQCRKDPAFRKKTDNACAADILFWMAAFAWVYEPRPGLNAEGKLNPSVLPMIPWDHQIPVIRTINEHLGLRDIGGEKARGEGASWIGVDFVWHWWKYGIRGNRQMQSIGMVSRNENAVDSPDDSDSLFWKIDWQMTMLPKWMCGERGVNWVRKISEHTLRNLDNGSMITGYACTGDVASGGRKGFMLVDELSKFARGPDQESMNSTMAVTKSRLVVSTYKGAHGAYFRLMHEPGNMVKLVLDWKDNQTRNRGLYRYAKGVLTPVDAENNPLPQNYPAYFKLHVLPSLISNGASEDHPVPADYPQDFFARILPALMTKGFVVEDTTRSPWYDEECLRPNATPQSIAEEYDRNPTGTELKPFSDACLAILNKTAERPLLVGQFSHDPDDLHKHEYYSTAHGPFRLWLKLDDKRGIPPGDFTISADISTGMGQSNSVATIFDNLTGRQVAEYCSNRIPPAEFADLCLALCWFFHEAILNWETNGSTGGAFSKKVYERRYMNYYKRPVVWKNQLRRAAVTAPGWQSTKDSKGEAFEEFDEGIRKGAVIIRAEEVRAECVKYSYEGNRIVHTGTGEGNDHGDRVVSAAIGYLAMKAHQVKGDSSAVAPKEGTMGWRMRQSEMEMADAEVYEFG